jgi:hypothetical protein
MSRLRPEQVKQKEERAGTKVWQQDSLAFQRLKQAM